MAIIIYYVSFRLSNKIVPLKVLHFTYISAMEVIINNSEGNEHIHENVL